MSNSIYILKPYERRRYDEALPLLMKVRRSFETRLGVKSPESATCYLWIGLVCEGAEIFM